LQNNAFDRGGANRTNLVLLRAAITKGGEQSEKTSLRMYRVFSEGN